jgi:glucokinase
MHGPLCSCGATACFEAFAAGTALGDRAVKAAQGNPDSFLGRLSTAEKIEARHVVDGVGEGDPTCVALLREEAGYLGMGFTALIHLFSPQRVIMGGGVSQAFDLLTDDIHAIIRRDAMGPFKDVPVVRAGLAENSGLVGAASLVLESIRRQR